MSATAVSVLNATLGPLVTLGGPDGMFDPAEEFEYDEEEMEEDACETTVLADGLSMAVLFSTSITLFIILTFTEKRATRCPGCCKGRGGILLSVNFLENKTSRGMIVAAFVLATVEIISAIFEMDEIGAVPKIVKVLFRGLMVGILNFIYLPLFHCVSEKTLLRQCLGLFYTLVVTCLTIAGGTSVCAVTELSLDKLFKQVVEWVITASAGIYLVYKFFYRIVIVSRRKVVPITKDPYQTEYVKSLLRKKSSVPNESGIPGRVKSVIYASTAGFRFSVTILTSIIVGVLIFIIVISSTVGHAVFWYRALSSVLDENRSALNETMPNIVVEIIRMVQGKKEDNVLKDISIADFLDTQLTVFGATFFVATAGAIIQVCCTVGFMLQNYRRNVFSMYRHEFDDSSIQGMDNVSLVVGAVQFAGYQIAHMVWGYALQLGVFFVIFLLLTEILIIPVLFGYWGVILAILDYLGPFIIILLMTKGTQKILVKYAFLVDRGKTFGIENRKCFYNMMFFMFFYNIFTGLIACIMRVIKATLVGVWFFPRLDRSVFPHRFEKMDSGFRSYICLLRLEELQTNVILLSFVQLLTEQYSTQREDLNTKDINMVEQRSPALNAARRKRARNRWFVAYTLMKNKKLQFERKGPPSVITSFQSTV